MPPEVKGPSAVPFSGAPLLPTQRHRFRVRTRAKEEAPETPQPPAVPRPQEEEETPQFVPASIPEETEAQIPVPPPPAERYHVSSAPIEEDTPQWAPLPRSPDVVIGTPSQVI